MTKLFAATALAFALGAMPALALNSVSDVDASGNTVTINTLTADKPGYIVVHEADASGAVPGKILGFSTVKAGDNDKVTVSLDQKLKPGTKLIVMLHEEANADNVFDPDDPAATLGDVQEEATVAK